MPVRHVLAPSLPLCLALLTCAPAQALDVNPEGSSGYQAKSLVKARQYMIATANPLASQAGERILARGGSAVDAIIAAQLVLNLVEPQSSGIGGGAFMLHYNAADHGLITYDSRETAPAAAKPDRFLHEGKPIPFAEAVNNGRAVATPGLLRGLALAHAEQGKLPWAELFQPAIELAEQGFAVSPRLNAVTTESLKPQAAGRTAGGCRLFSGCTGPALASRPYFAQPGFRGGAQTSRHRRPRCLLSWRCRARYRCRRARSCPAGRPERG